MTHGFRPGWTSPLLLLPHPTPSLAAVTGLLPRQRQETAANLCLACRGWSTTVPWLDLPWVGLTPTLGPRPMSRGHTACASC